MTGQPPPTPEQARRRLHEHRNPRLYADYLPPPPSRHPDRPTAVYRIYDAQHTLLYVGASASVLHRAMQHARDAAKPWWTTVSRIDVSWYPTPAEAMLKELEAIAYENPRHNRAGVTAPARAYTPRPRKTSPPPPPPPPPTDRVLPVLLRLAAEHPTDGVPHRELTRRVTSTLPRRLRPLAAEVVRAALAELLADPTTGVQAREVSRNPVNGRPVLRYHVQKQPLPLTD